MDYVVDLIDALEGEVNNGGFHQYFYKSAGDSESFRCWNHGDLHAGL
jgi:hypothetical protein